MNNASMLISANRKQLTKTLLVLCASVLIAAGVTSCEYNNPNANTYSTEVSEDPELDASKAVGYNYIDSVYVPVYSDIYSQGKHLRFLLTSTLSIRNTSYTDTIAIHSIEYYDTRGDKVRDFLEHPIFVRPMATLEYVIEEDDRSGGSGANFMVIWSAKHAEVETVIQAIMISVSGQQGVAFKTDGVSINH